MLEVVLMVRVNSHLQIKAVVNLIKSISNNSENILKKEQNRIKILTDLLYQIYKGSKEQNLHPYSPNRKNSQRFKDSLMSLNCRLTKETRWFISL